MSLLKRGKTFMKEPWSVPKTKNLKLYDHYLSILSENAIHSLH